MPSVGRTFSKPRSDFEELHQGCAGTYLLLAHLFVSFVGSTANLQSLTLASPCMVSAGPLLGQMFL